MLVQLAVLTSKESKIVFTKYAQIFSKYAHNVLGFRGFLRMGDVELQHELFAAATVDGSQRE